jgi:hypothetical protein
MLALGAVALELISLYSTYWGQKNRSPAARDKRPKKSIAYGERLHLKTPVRFPTVKLIKFLPFAFGVVSFRIPALVC